MTPHGQKTERIHPSQGFALVVKRIAKTVGYEKWKILCQLTLPSVSNPGIAWPTNKTISNTGSAKKCIKNGFVCALQWSKIGAGKQLGLEIGTKRCFMVSANDTGRKAINPFLGPSSPPSTEQLNLAALWIADFYTILPQYASKLR